MKIEKLISVYERLLPIYREAYKSKSLSGIVDSGLCFAVLATIGSEAFYEFGTVMQGDGYYKKLINRNGYLFPKPKTYKGLKPRIDFMESEIKSLKRLIKKGYTHV